MSAAKSESRTHPSFDKGILANTCNDVAGELVSRRTCRSGQRDRLGDDAAVGAYASECRQRRRLSGDAVGSVASYATPARRSSTSLTPVAWRDCEDRAYSPVCSPRKASGCRKSENEVRCEARVRSDAGLRLARASFVSAHGRCSTVSRTPSRAPETREDMAAEAQAPVHPERRFIGSCWPAWKR